MTSLAIDVARKSSAINCVEDKCHFSVNEVCKFLLDLVSKSNTSSVLIKKVK